MSDDKRSAFEVFDAAEEQILERLADGERVEDIALTFGFKRRQLFYWKKAGGAERLRRWADALTEAAHAHAEKAGQILEEGRNPSSTAEAQMTKERASHERWLAERRDRLSYGAEGFNLNIGIAGDVGQLHLDALRQRGSVALHSPKPPLMIEGEVVEDSDDA